MPARQERLSWEPLWQLAQGRGLSMRTLQRRVGSDGRELYRWREAGGVPEYAADRVALALGVMPGEIWGDEWWALADARRRAARTASQRRWRSKPEAAERNRVARRAAYAASAEYERARQRRYYAANAERERARKRDARRRREVA